MRVHVFLFALAILPAATWLACTGDDPDIEGRGDAGTGDATGTGDGATLPDAGGLRVTFLPASAELRPGGSLKVAIRVESDSPTAGPIKLAVAPSASDAGAAPMTLSRSSLELTSGLQGDVDVTVEVGAKHGDYAVDVAATASFEGDRRAEARASLPIAVVGAPGFVDTGLGGGFVDVCPLVDSSCILADVHAYADGRLLLAGTAFDTTNFHRLLLARVLADGSLDPTFGDVQGAARTGFSITKKTDLRSYGNATIVEAADGTIFVAFTVTQDAFPGQIRIAVARFSAAGVLDTTWADGGLLLTDLRQGTGPVVPLTMTDAGALQAVATLPDVLTAVVRRYSAAGAVDTTFADGGTAIVPYATIGFGSALAVDPMGRLITGGVAEVDGGFAPAAARLTPSGAVDGTFPIRTFPSIGGNGSITIVAPHKQGYLFTGKLAPSGPGPEKMRIYRTLENGESDTGFNLGFGYVEVDAGATAAQEAFDLLVLDDNSFMVTNGAGGGTTFFVMRIDQMGAPVAAFGNQGLAEEIPGRARRVALTASGRKMVVAGIDPTNSKIRLARYWMK
jgi:uncharacterized delta-60 repeat protein